MEGLRSLIRLQNWKVDEKRRELGVLEARRAAHIKQGEMLEAEMLQEQQIASRDNLQEHYGFYAEKVIERRAHIKSQVKEDDAEITIIHDELSLLYQELKRFEISLERREKEQELEEKRKEQNDLDEICINQHTRAEKLA